MSLDRKQWRSGVYALLAAGTWLVGCGAESPEVPDDDNDGGMGGSFGGAQATGGSLPTGGTPSTGGTFPTGGTPSTGGTFPTGGTPSTGGTFPTGGTPATGGGGGMTTTCGTTVAAPGDTSIDDLEAGMNQIKAPRVGYWYTYNDKSAGCMQTPAPDSGGLSPFIPAPGQGNGGTIGARMQGGACATWGAGMGFDLANCNGKSGPYDATVFGGISFWYKSTSPVRIMVGNLQNIPPNDANAPGGTCADPADMCFNHHGEVLPAAPAGTMHTSTFATLSQAYGTMRPFLKNQLINVQFQVDQMATTFDVVVDDLVFVP